MQRFAEKDSSTKHQKLSIKNIWLTQVIGPLVGMIHIRNTLYYSGGTQLFSVITGGTHQHILCSQKNVAHLMAWEEKCKRARQNLQLIDTYKNHISDDWTMPSSNIFIIKPALAKQFTQDDPEKQEATVLQSSKDECITSLFVYISIGGLSWSW